MSQINIVNAPKTGTFQMRINPEVKSEAERIFSQCGMTLTDAVNVFLQQTLNIGGMPFIVTSDSKEALRNQAIAILMSEIQKGRNSVKSDSDWVSEEEMLAHFEVDRGGCVKHPKPSWIWKKYETILLWNCRIQRLQKTLSVPLPKIPHH